MNEILTQEELDFLLRGSPPSRQAQEALSPLPGAGHAKRSVQGSSPLPQEAPASTGQSPAATQPAAGIRANDGLQATSPQEATAQAIPGAMTQDAFSAPSPGKTSAIPPAGTPPLHAAPQRFHREGVELRRLAALLSDALSRACDKAVLFWAHPEAPEDVFCGSLAALLPEEESIFLLLRLDPFGEKGLLSLPAAALEDLLPGEKTGAGQQLVQLFRELPRCLTLAWMPRLISVHLVRSTLSREALYPATFSPRLVSAPFFLETETFFGPSHLILPARAWDLGLTD